ncbi:MAG TPA: hypothetical protein VFZ66_27775 [Herpetosiphonaceae bacterium]
MPDHPFPSTPWLFHLGVLVAGVVGAWIFAPGDALAWRLLPWWLLAVACLLAGRWLHAQIGWSSGVVVAPPTAADDLTIPLVSWAPESRALRDPLDDLTIPASFTL